MYITLNCLDQPKELPKSWCDARKVWKLKSRLKRLYQKGVSTKSMMAWFEISDHIAETIDKLAELGVSVEDNFND